MCECVCVCVCVFQCRPSCTITRLGFRARRIDGVECGLFLIHAPIDRRHYVWDEYLYSVLEELRLG